MKWLQRLKSAPTPDANATKPTEPCFVGFVACPDGPSEKFTAPQQPPANEATSDPDRWCWPHSSAMSTAEIDAFTVRLARFTDKGLSLDDAEALADKLVVRDRERDNRRLCLECVHLSGFAPASWRCGNWQAAGIAIRPHDTQLPAELVVQLQRCGGFTPHLTPTPQGNDDDHNCH